MGTIISIVFFASIFSAVLKPGIPFWARLVAIAIVFLNETLWDGGLGLLLSTAHAQRVYARAKANIDRTAGVVMSLFGLRLIWEAIGRNTIDFILSFGSEG